VIYRLALNKKRRAQDIGRLAFVKDQQERVLAEDEEIKTR